MTDYSAPLIELRRLLRQVEEACNDKDWIAANERAHAMFSAWITLDRAIWAKTTERWHVV